MFPFTLGKTIIVVGGQIICGNKKNNTTTNDDDSDWEKITDTIKDWLYVKH